MTKKPYTGTDILDVMACAKNYNTHLVTLLTHNQDHLTKFVDFGAGSGTYSQMLADKGYEVLCVEPDDKLAEQLISLGFYVQDSIEKLHDIEFLYSLNVLEHIEDDCSVVSEIFSQIKAGGNIFIYVPAFMCLYTSLDARVGHFRRYRKKQLAGLVERAGFIVDDARYVDSLGFFVTLVFKWFGNDKGEINPRLLKIYDSVIFPLSRFCDLLFFPLFGKNVMLRAHKP